MRLCRIATRSGQGARHRPAQKKDVSNMSPFKPLMLACASLFLALAPATAQSPGQRITIEQSSGAPRQEGQVRIQTSINFFVAGPTGEGEEAQKLRDRARRTIYEMAARECDLLRDVIAKDCRMQSVSNNINRQYGNQQQEGFTITGSMSFQIT